MHPTKESVIHAHWVESFLGPNPSQHDIDEVNRACDEFTEDCLWEDAFLKENPSLIRERLKAGLMAFKAKHKPGWAEVFCLRGPRGMDNFATLEDAQGAVKALGLGEVKIVKAEGLGRHALTWEIIITPLIAAFKVIVFGETYFEKMKIGYGVKSTWEAK